MLHTYVLDWIRFTPLSAEDVELEDYLRTGPQRHAAVKAVLKEAVAYMAGLTFGTPEQALYMAERQSQGMQDWWHFAAIYWAWVERPDAATWLLTVLVTVEVNRPDYLVEDWREVLKRTASAVV